MIEIFYTNTFVKRVHKLDKNLIKEILEKIEMFKNPSNHKKLDVHKLHGKLSDKYAFSVNYKVRIVFQYSEKSQAVMLAIDDHDVYK